MQQDRFHAFIGEKTVERKRSGPPYKLTAAQQDAVWTAWRGGQSVVAIAAAAGGGRVESRGARRDLARDRGRGLSARDGARVGACALDDQSRDSSAWRTR